MRRDSVSDACCDGLRRAAGLDDVAVLRVLQSMEEGGLRGYRGKAGTKLTVRYPHHTLLPAVAGALELPHGQRVEKFIGNQIQRRFGQIVDTVVPLGLRQASGLC